MGQTRKLGSSLKTFSELNTQVVLIVPHESCRTRWWAERAKNDKLTVLADGGFLASCLYGVAFQMRIHSDISNTPGTFLIDRSGILRWAHIGEGKTNWKDRPTVEQVLQQIKSIQP